MLLALLAGLACAMALASSAAASLTEFKVPTGSPGGITAGPDGALWFTEPYDNKIGRLTTSGTFTEFGGLTAPRSGYPGPVDIAPGRDGRLWFTEFDPNRIGAITTAGVVTEYSNGLTSGAGPGRIAAGADGRLWFTELQENKIGAITTDGVIREYPLPKSDTRPNDITAAPDGALWFTETSSGAIGRILTTGTVSEFPVASGDLPRPSAITGANDGGIWFTDSYSSKIGRFAAQNRSANYTGPALNSFGLAGITFGPDGALWFTESASGFIGRVTIGGLITNTIKLPRAPVTGLSSEPGDIVSGPDGALWFTERGTGMIGRITTDVAPPPTVEMKLVLVPPTDPGRFSLSIDGQVKRRDAGHGDTTGKVPVSVMDHWLQISPSTRDYSLAVSCQDHGGLGATLPTPLFDTQASLSVPTESDIVCTIVNTRLYPPSNLTVTQDSGTVRASWELPPSPPETVTGVLEFSPSPDTDADGFFTDPETIVYGYDTTDTGFDSAPLTFPPGTYYVHVSAYPPDACDEFSCPERFSSPPVRLVVPAPPGTSPGGSPGQLQTGSGDKLTAFSSLRVPSRQRLGALYIQAAMGEAGTISARGRVLLGKQSRSYKLGSVSAPAVPGTSVRLRLRLPAKTAATLRRALKRHRKISAKVEITATDAAGNQKRELRTVRLRP